MERIRESKSGMCSRIRAFFQTKTKAVYNLVLKVLLHFSPKIEFLKIQDLKTYV